MTVEFMLDRVEFVALNGGPQFKFTEAISFTVNCETQDEIDYFWEKLSADGGSTGRCGWLKDKFGLSWQVNPVVLGDMLADPDKAKAARVMNAMMEMDKIDIAALEKAARRNDK
jgi:predicted 3-demethylubiquinone-9 3-methyltransferase (glyoxalase superfamily)